MKRHYQHLIDGYDKGAKPRLISLKNSPAKPSQCTGRALRWSAMAPALLRNNNQWAVAIRCSEQNEVSRIRSHGFEQFYDVFLALLDFSGSKGHW